MKKIISILAVLFLIPSLGFADPVFYEKRYKDFTVWLDCNEHGPVIFHYELDKDTGNKERSGSFKTDPSVPDACQPNSGKSYRTSTVDPSTGTWDRGHLVPANHMDNSKDSMGETFYVTNILPQQSKFNQSKGAWFKTERISECYREISKISIWGGVIWGNDKSNDFFTETHGIKTPDYWWKVIYRHDKKEYVAWLFPNHKSSSEENMDDYLISLKDLKDALSFVPDFGEIEDSSNANNTPSASWPVEKSGHDLICEGHKTSEG